MRQLLSANSRRTIHRTTTAMAAVVVLIFLFSCQKSTRSVIPTFEHPDSIAIMSTYGVSTIISDSGHICYRINADEWLVYSKRKPPYWAFEKGLYLEKFDTLMNVEATIKCDTAFYFNEMKLWKLIGNVDIKNQKGEKTIFKAVDIVVFSRYRKEVVLYLKEEKTFIREKMEDLKRDMSKKEI